MYCISIQLPAFPDEANSMCREGIMVNIYTARSMTNNKDSEMLLSRLSQLSQVF